MFFGKTTEVVKLLIDNPKHIMVVPSKKVRRRIIKLFKLPVSVSRRIKTPPCPDTTLEGRCFYWFDEPLE